MEKNILEQMIAIEEKILLGRDLLEVMKSYCEQNCEQSSELATLYSIMDLTLKNQNDLTTMLGNLV